MHTIAHDDAAACDAPCREPPSLLGNSAALRSLRARIAKIAEVGRTTLIVGPTGCGKEVVARQLYAESPRRQGPFVTVHCGALPENLEESELFGHRRGAFTGATEVRSGLVRAAHNGTLFLDEVNSLSLSAQAKLLRFLENGEYRAVGSDRVERSMAWVIAASNTDLNQAVSAKAFRQDLLYRLDVVKVEVPPLRLRGEDVLLLADHFLEATGRRDCTISAQARQALMRHDWPGNVRELKHKVERAALFAGVVIDPIDLDLAPAEVSAPPEPPGAEPAPPLESQLWSLVDRGGLTLVEAVRVCERLLIEAALRAEQQNRTRAAHKLGIHVRTIFKKLAR